MPQEIIFGYDTALQICRSSCIPWKGSRIAHARYAPVQAPSAADLADAVKRLGNLYPDIAITLPLHYLISKVSRQHTTHIAHPHTCTISIPGTSLCYVADGILVATPPLAFIQECMRRDFIDRLRLGWEICGSYQSGLCGLPKKYEISPLVSSDELRSYASRNSGIKGSRKSLQSLQYVADESASPRETQLGLTLGLPTRYGGGGLGRARMNFEVVTTPAARVICGKSTLRLDLSWPGRKYDIEYQSEENHGDGMRVSDSRRENALKSMGYSVLSITRDEFNSFATTMAFTETLRKRFGKRNPTKFDDYHARKVKLRCQLGLPIGFEE